MAKKSAKDIVPHDPTLEYEAIKTELIRLNDNIIENNKIFKSIESYLNLIYKDRDLLSGHDEKLSGIRELILNFDRHNENLTKDVQKELAETKTRVEEKTEEVKDTVEHHVGELVDKKIIKVPNKSIFKKIMFWNGT